MADFCNKSPFGDVLRKSRFDDNFCISPKDDFARSQEKFNPLRRNESQMPPNGPIGQSNGALTAAIETTPARALCQRSLQRCAPALTE
jgi:hypothetical protein